VRCAHLPPGPHDLPPGAVFPEAAPANIPPAAVAEISGCELVNRPPFIEPYSAVDRSLREARHETRRVRWRGVRSLCDLHCLSMPSQGNAIERGPLYAGSPSAGP